jgi:hypothetical protein
MGSIKLYYRRNRDIRRKLMVQILSVELKTPEGLVIAHSCTEERAMEQQSKQQNVKLCEEVIFNP